jgi:hypothetical protein
LKAGDIAKFLFSKAYGKAPHVVISASNDKAAALRSYRGATTINDFLWSTIDPPAANTTYQYDYFITQ